MRDGCYKLVIDRRTQQAAAAEGEEGDDSLPMPFDLEADLAETTDLAADDAEGTHSPVALTPSTDESAVDARPLLEIVADERAVALPKVYEGLPEPAPIHLDHAEPIALIG